MVSWQPVYVGIGSNLDDPRSQVTQAIDRLASIAQTRRVLVAPLYYSSPLGPVAQADFINTVAGLLTFLSPEVLLGELHAIEVAMGRPKCHEKWGPRRIDLDLLVYGRERRADTALALPHPGIVERNFVLYPLADIAPDLDVPGLGRVAGLARRVTSAGIRRFTPA